MDLISFLLTLPLIAPPLPDIDRGSSQWHWAGSCASPCARIERSVALIERDEREVCQVDLMDLTEDLLPQPRIGCRQFLLCRAHPGHGCSRSTLYSIGRDLVAGEQGGIVRVIAKTRCSQTRQCHTYPPRLPWAATPSPRQEGAKERVCGIVLDVELDADRLEVALDDRFSSAAPCSVGFVEYSNSRRCPPLLRTPSAPFTQPLSESN